MAHPFLELKDPPSFARAKPSPPLNLQELPTELLESIFLYLTPETLLSCSRAASRFTQVIDSGGFFDLYCKTTLQAPWVTSDMVLRTKGVFHKVLQMWYLQNITLCHPNVIFKNCNKLLSIGLLKYAIKMWLVSNMSISYQIPIENENKSDVRIYEIYDKDAKSLFIKVAVLFPKFIEMTLFNVRTASFGVGNPYMLPFIMFKNDVLERGYLDNFNCKYHFEIICRYPTEDCDWHRPAVVILVGKDSWIGWCGSVEKFGFQFTDTWGRCKLALNAPVTDTQKAFRDTFTRFVEIPENVGLSHYLYDCFNVKVTHTLKALLGSAVVGVPLWEKHSSLMEDLARKIERKLERLKLPKDRIKLLQHYLDDCLQQRSISGQSIERKPSKTCYVAILRYLHRILNNVFYPECMCYLGNVQCCRYLALTRMGDKLLSNIRMTHADTARDVIKSYCEHFSVHHLPPKLWPTHLLSHAITAAPVCAKVAQLDVMLWTKGLHSMPVTDKTIRFITAQVETCGLMTQSLSQLLSLKQCPPLGGLIRCCHHGDDTVYRRL
ncbi:uncharacterized protein [Haliotis cracherodii]|uniref:uncharacterized protein n=1 Tax=Haliotis cracherodii TaxID=6455 RepID=UPI0039E88209